MAVFRKEDIYRLKETVSIVQVAQDLGLQVFKGNRIRCLHPERHSHGDRTPSLSLFDSQGTFKCWVCDDVKGDVISLVRMVQGCSFPQALEFLSRYAGVGVEPQNSQGYQNSQGASKSPQSGEFISSPSRSQGLAPQCVGPNAQNRQAPPSPGSNLSQPHSWPRSKPLADSEDVRKVLVHFLNQLKEPEGRVERYLNGRKIFRHTILKQRIRYVHDYRQVSDAMKSAFEMELLQRAGLFNDKGNLRYFKHPLIFPYLSPDNKLVYFQARAIEKGTEPKELSLRGAIPFPYNAPALDGRPGVLYVCEGVIDTLTLLERIPLNVGVVGIPGAKNFKTEWVQLFKNKRVRVIFDNDEAGKAGQQRVVDLLSSAGIEAEALDILQTGLDLNDYFTKLKRSDR